MGRPITLGGIKITQTNNFFLRKSEKTIIFSTLNAEIFEIAQENKRFKDILNSDFSDISIDGQWVLWAVRRKYGKKHILRKLSGSELIFKIPAECATRNLRVALIGATTESNAQAVAKLKESHPNLDIVGFSPPYSGLPLSNDFTSQIINFIKEKRPTVIICGFGPPKEQFWAHNDYDKLTSLGVSHVFCFGGAIDMVSGSASLTPMWIKNAGLETIYRLLDQPKRLKRLPRVLRFIKTFIFEPK